MPSLQVMIAVAVIAFLLLLLLLVVAAFMGVKRLTQIRDNIPTTPTNQPPPEVVFPPEEWLEKLCAHLFHAAYDGMFQAGWDVFDRAGFVALLKRLLERGETTPEPRRVPDPPADGQPEVTTVPAADHAPLDRRVPGATLGGPGDGTPVNWLGTNTATSDPAGGGGADQPVTGEVTTSRVTATAGLPPGIRVDPADEGLRIFRGTPGSEVTQGIVTPGPSPTDEPSA